MPLQKKSAPQTVLPLVTARRGGAEQPAGLDSQRAFREPVARIDAAAVLHATQALGDIGAQLDVPALSAEEQREGGARVKQSRESVVRAYAFGLRASPVAVAATGVQPDALITTLRKRDKLYAIEIGAGRIKTRALDGLLLTGAFGGDLVGRTLEWLRGRLLAEDITATEQEQLVADWGPFLALLNREQAAREGQTARTEARVVRLTSEAADAEADLKLQKVTHAVRAGLPVDEETLLAAARTAETPKAARRKARR